MDKKNNQNFDEYGLPRYFDMQAKIGFTKHVGGAKATRELLKMCQATSDKVVLNVGCGAGYTSTFIVENFGCKVVGVDIKENMIEASESLAQKKGLADKTEFRQADAQDLPFEDDRFDIVITESVNIFVPDQAKAISEYKRVVKPGGFVGLSEAILIKEPSSKIVSFLEELVGHQMVLPAHWESLLHQAGFTEIVSRTYAESLGEEARNQFGFFRLGEYLRLLGRAFKIILKDPVSRHLMKQATATSPAEYIQYLGYGLFVGKKV